MPLQWRLQVLGAQIEERLNRQVRFSVVELLHLQGSQRNAALDELTSGRALPFILLGDQVLSTGPLDADVIVEGIERCSPA